MKCRPRRLVGKCDRSRPFSQCTEQAGFAAHPWCLAVWLPKERRFFTWVLPACGTGPASVRAKGTFLVPVMRPCSGPEVHQHPRTVRLCAKHTQHMPLVMLHSWGGHALYVVADATATKHCNSDYHATRRSSDAEPCKCWVSVEKLKHRRHGFSSPAVLCRFNHHGPHPQSRTRRTLC